MHSLSHHLIGAELPYPYENNQKIQNFVKKCQSLTYKADYTPNEILERTSSLDEDAFLWEKYSANRSKLTINQCQY